VTEPRRFPPPWTVEETDACFIVRDHNGQALAYVYFEEEPGRRAAAHLLTRDAATRTISPQQHQRVMGGDAANKADSHRGGAPSHKRECREVIQHPDDARPTTKDFSGGNTLSGRVQKMTPLRVVDEKSR
jgi:hypothetical protein